MPEDSHVAGKMPRYELLNRYVFTGRLEMQTALHIGGGRYTLSHSDSPIVLTPDQKPFIPGSSFKGALRSTIEKLVPALPEGAQLTSCGLPSKDDPANPCPTARQSFIVQQIRKREQELRRNRQMGEAANYKETVMEEEREKLCSTCQLFGSPFAAAHINVNDLYLSEDEWSGFIQVRDGVAIDRDSEKAKDRLKYDFEVVPAQAVFALSLTLENASPQDLQIISIGLSEFVHGYGAIGGMRSRGLGACRLNDLRVASLDLEKAESGKRKEYLKNFLLHNTFPLEEPGEVFLERHINAIFV